MKKVLLVLTMLGCLSSYAQSISQEEVYDKIKNSYAWINYYLLKEFVTINMSSENWDWVLKNDNLGISSVNAVGNDLAKFIEITSDNRINSDCRYQEREECIDRINNIPNKIFIEMNATNLKPYDTNRKLAMQALSTISGFIGNNNLYGTNAGWRPKTNSTKFILNIDNGTGQPTVIWNKDGSVATITMYVGAEAPDWNENLLKQLNIY